MRPTLRSVQVFFSSAKQWTYCGKHSQILAYSVSYRELSRFLGGNRCVFSCMDDLNGQLFKKGNAQNIFDFAIQELYIDQSN